MPIDDDEGHARKLVTILAADVAGYSRLMADDELGTMRTLTEYREVFSKHVTDHKGRIVDTAGDSVLATFDSVVEAVQAAVDIQRELLELNETLLGHRKMHFRIGVNLGDIIIRDDGTVYGDGVNVAARLESLAEPGGIMISGSAHEQVEGKLDVSLSDAGEHEIKNIAKPVRAFRVLAAGEIAPAVHAKSRPRRAIAAVAVAVVTIIAGVTAWQFLTSGVVDDSELSKLAETDGEFPPLPTGPAIAVLPFANLSGDDGQDFFVDGVTEELIAALSRFQALNVIARTSTLQYRDRAADVRDIGKALGVDFVLEGSVRRDAAHVRITAQLIDTADGTHMWSETYDRDLSAAGIFAVQDDIAEQIAARLAGRYGILMERRITQARGKPPENLESYDCVLLASVYWENMSLKEYPALLDCLEQAVASEPDYVDGWVMLSEFYSTAHEIPIDARPDPAALALAAAERAVELAPRRYDAHAMKSSAHYFLHQIDAFLEEAETTISLNPNDPETLALIGLHVAYVGQWERGIAMMHRAMALQPDHPTWWLYATFWDHYRSGRYDEALADALKIDLEDYVWTHTTRAVAYARLGRMEEARAAALRTAEVYPGFSIEDLRAESFKYNLEESIVTDIVAALRLAGVPESSPEPPSRPVIAVLPFDNMSGDPEQDYFADGITEDIITRLAQFQDLAVIARNSSFQYKGEAVNVVDVGEALGAGYIVEGSVRRSANDIRVTAQLLDTTDGTHHWAKAYDRDLSTGSVFDIQDEITEAIVGVIAGTHGVIARTATAAARQRPKSLDSYDCVLLAYAYEREFTEEGYYAAKTCLEGVLAREPDYVDGLTAFNLIATDGYSHGWGMPDDEREASLGKALTAGRRAIALAPENAMSHWQLAYAEFVGGDLASFYTHAERALALNPNDADVMGQAGALMAFSGEYDRGLGLIKEAMTRNPHHPKWWYLGLVSAYWSTGRVAEAQTAVGKVDTPDNFWWHVWRAILAGETEDLDAAAAALADLERVYPGFTIATYHDEAAYWQVTPDFVERAVKALRTAGMPDLTD